MLKRLYSDAESYNLWMQVSVDMHAHVEESKFNDSSWHRETFSSKGIVSEQESPF